MKDLEDTKKEGGVATETRSGAGGQEHEGELVAE